MFNRTNTMCSKVEGCVEHSNSVMMASLTLRKVVVARVWLDWL